MNDDQKFLAELLKNTIDDLEIEDPLLSLPALTAPVFFEDRTLDVEDDYKLARTVMRNQLQMFDTASRQALVGLIASQHPKSIEAFAALMSQMTSTAEKLLKTQKDVKEIQAVKPGQGGFMPDRGASAFSGTTNDLLDQFGDAQDPHYVIDNDA